MASVLGHIREVRLQILVDAGKRWEDRQLPRQTGLREIERRGVGAADTVKRQVEFAQRMRNAARYGSLNTREAIIGTNDLVAYAPSEQSRAAARPVARIVTLRGSGYKPQGIATGFLITSTGLLITNHHVFPSRGDARGYGANFRHEEDENGIKDGQYFELDPDRFFVSDPSLDFAIVAVKPRGLADDDLSSVGFARLIEATGKVATGEPLNIIQHPGGGPRRFAIRNNTLVDILPEGYLHYEGDTLRGSSGSPVLTSRWELVALHHSAVPEMKNGAPQSIHGRPFDPATDELEDVKWIANEGTRASFIVDSLRKMQPERPDERELLNGLIASTVDPLGKGGLLESAQRMPENVSPGGQGAMGHVFNISGPTTIYAYSPAPETGEASPPVVRTATAALAVEKTLVFDPDYHLRGGYNPMFLGKDIPTPTVDAARADEMYTVGDYKEFFEGYRDVPEVNVSEGDTNDPMILDYHHYSLAFNKRFYMCMWTASNCDYRGVMRQDTRPRGELGGENWHVDPRVPPDLQLQDRDVYKPGTRIDRGHIVRREDNCWGSAGVETEYANSDTYHYTNCTPQHEAFNQENPQDHRKPKELDYSAFGAKGVWGEFEGALESQIESGGGKAVIFAGPVLKNFVDTRDWGTGKVSTPRKFWKVIIVPESPRRGANLLAYGYVFDQSDVVKQFGLTFEEAIDLPKFDRKRETLAEIESMSGVVFPKVLQELEAPLPN
nr:DNA/RNA non-specific endonuclease [uncultured Rhodoferax sp.]